jgi:YD repeat-containing protein
LPETDGGPVTLPPASTLISAAPPLVVPGYEVLSELGRGGMGVVHHARHVASGRLVALKVLRDALLDSPQQRSRFRTETEALARLRHPNVVGLIEAGEQDGRPYFVMELVTGGSLERRLAGPRLPPGEAAEMVETLARAAAFAHQQGIVHRDLKPGNILLAEDGTPKLNDFGLARQLDADTRQTNTGAVLGTPRYMSPEQAEGRPERIGPATDVWALGVILYEMLTGTTPFAGSLVELLDQIRTAEPEPPSKVQPEVPRDLETICLKCLHKDPGRRYASALDLAEDLRRFREDRPIKARRVGLRERAVKWRRRNPVTATLAATAVLLLLAGSALGLWYWNRYQRVKIEYYATFTSRYGVKEGVIPLSPKEAQQRDISYKFYRVGGQVVRVEVVNSRGELAVATEGTTAQLGRQHDEETGSAGEKESRFEYTRNQQGKLVEETAYDRNGDVLWVLNYTSPNTAHYTTPRTKAGSGFGSGAVQGLPQPRTRSGASYLQFTWSKEGFEAEVRYLDSRGKPSPDDSHAYGKRQEHDSRGLVARQTWLDARGQPTRHTRILVATIAFKYDERGKRVEERYFDAKENPCLNRDGLHRARGGYDERGNQVEVVYFGVDDRPCINRKGFHRATGRYDESGNRVKEANFGVDDRPCLNRNGVHKDVTRFDERGNRIEQAHFGMDGRPCRNRHRFHKATGRHDDRGNLVEEAFFGVDERPCLHADGYHKDVRQFDEHGNVTRVACFGVDGRPCLHRANYHRATARYDERGNRVEEAYFGVDGRPCLHQDGYHRAIGRYDERGNRIEETFFGVDERPCLHKRRFHKGIVHFDERGNGIEESYFDVNGRPCPQENGFHSATGRYDERGNRIEEAFFGVDGRRCLHNDGFHKSTSGFDERDNRVEAAYFDVEGRPCQQTNGFHRATARYDEYGNRVEEAYFRVDGRPCLHRNGFHKLITRHDERGNMIEQACFNREGRPCLSTEGIHRFTATYDERGNRLEMTAYDVEDRKLGRRFFDDQGRTLRLTVFVYQSPQTIDQLGKAVAWITRTVDDKGRVCEETYHGSDGRLVRNKHGQARLTIAYDEKGTARSRSYFDENGKPLTTQVVVQRVLPNTQADRLKIQVGDILLSYDGRPLKQLLDLPTWPAGKARKDNRPRLLVILRKGETITVKVAAEPLGVNLADVAVGAAK